MIDVKVPDTFILDTFIFYPVENAVQRQALFISHANPEDNEFTIWLGSHLSGAGYEVWADVLRVRGGEDWARKLEHALRERACKVLLVGTPRGVNKQGVRNEIQIASEVAKKINDENLLFHFVYSPMKPPSKLFRPSISTS